MPTPKTVFALTTTPGFFSILLGGCSVITLVSCGSLSTKTVSVDEKPIVLQQENRRETPSQGTVDEPSGPLILAKPIEVEVDCNKIDENLQCSANKTPFVREFPAFSEIVLPINGQNWHFEIQTMLELTQPGIDRFSQDRDTLGGNPYRNTSHYLEQTKFNEALEKALLDLPQIYKDGFDESYKQDVYLKVLEGEQNLRGLAESTGLKIKSFVLDYQPHQ